MLFNKKEYNTLFIALVCTGVSFIYKAYMMNNFGDGIMVSEMFLLVAGGFSFWLAGLAAIFMSPTPTEAQVAEWDAYYNRKRF